VRARLAGLVYQVSYVGMIMELGSVHFRVVDFTSGGRNDGSKDWDDAASGEGVQAA